MSTTGVNEPNNPAPMTPKLPEGVTVSIPPKPKYKHHNIHITLDVKNKLKDLKATLGFRSFNSLMNFLVEINRNAVPFATKELIFKNNKPLIIAGETGSGKTYFMRDLIKNDESSPNIFVIDSSHEYTELEEIDLSDVLGMRWDRVEGRRVRFCPNSNRMVGEGQVRSILFQLNFLKNDGALKKWFIIIEEGHRYKMNQDLQEILMEGRKSTRKVIVVSTDNMGYSGIPTLKPKPWQE